MYFSLFYLVCEDQRDFMLFFTGDRGIVNSFGKCDGTSDFPHVLFFLETIEARELLSRQISHHLLFLTSCHRPVLNEAALVKPLFPRAIGCGWW